MKMILINIIVGFIFFLVGCASETQIIKPWPKYEGPMPFKETAMMEIGEFSLENRIAIYEQTDKLAFHLLMSPYSKVIMEGESKTMRQLPVLKLSDRDSDDNADEFAQYPKSSTKTQNFSFIFDFNKDGRIDYCVFNGGPALSDKKKMVWMNYHWIDSNKDGKIDIMVYKVDLNNDKFIDDDIEAWLYDTNFDGIIDRAEYLGKNFQQDIEEANGIFVFNGPTGKISLKKEDSKQSIAGLSALLSEINELNK